MVAAARGGHSCLELGCGTGRLLNKIGGNHSVGIDISMAMLKHGDAPRVCQATANHLPFADNHFDTIVATKGVFRYLDPTKVFSECSRVLSTGGLLFVHQYTDNVWSIRRPSQVAGHLNDYDDYDNLADLNNLIRTNVFLWRSIRFWPYVARIPTPIAGRLWSHCVLVFTKI